MSESLESFHQERERRKFLRQLEIKVDLAFQNRRKLTYLPEQKTTQEYIEEAEKDRQFFQDLPDDYIIEAEEYTEEPFQVSVTNFRDYKDLLIISLRRLAEAGHFEEKKIPQTVQETLEQES